MLGEGFLDRGGKKSCKNTQNKTGSYGLLHLPADSPVLIQSGFAMLAIAKISAARNRHPEMIVSLSISPADESVNDEGEGGGGGGRYPNVTPSVERHRLGCYQSNLAPFSRSLLLWFCCAFCSNVSSFASSKREPPATKGSNTTHKSITSQAAAVVRGGKNDSSVGAESPNRLCRLSDPFSSSGRRGSGSIGYGRG